jgi:hypothetical protein
MYGYNLSAVALLSWSIFTIGCSGGNQQKSLAPVVEHLQAKGYKGEANPLQGDILGADEVASFAGKDTTVKSRIAIAGGNRPGAGGNHAADGSHDFATVLYLFSDSDKASAYSKRSKGVANGPYVIEVFKGDDKLVAAFKEYRP